jgi:hypothetical protein
MRNMRSVKKFIYIFCEDEKSAKYYFNSFNSDEEFRRNYKNILRVQVYNPSNSPIKLVEKAIKFRSEDKNREKGDEYWVVFDKDKHTNIPKAYALAQRENINIAISIICFEFWVLLHYAHTTKPFNKCDDLIRYIKKNHFAKYEKCANCFDELRDKIGNAVKHAKKVEKSVKNELDRGKKVYELSAYTNVHHIVSKLIPSK